MYETCCLPPSIASRWRGLRGLGRRRGRCGTGCGARHFARGAARTQTSSCARIKLIPGDIKAGQRQSAELVRDPAGEIVVLEREFGQAAERTQLPRDGARQPVVLGVEPLQIREVTQLRRERT